MAVLAGCSYLGAPEEIRLVARQDLAIYQAAELGHSAQIGTLRAGEAATVLACEDAKSTIPIKIRTGAGVTGYVSAPGIRLHRRPAGWGTKDVVRSCEGVFGPVSEPWK